MDTKKEKVIKIDKEINSLQKKISSLRRKRGALLQIKKGARRVSFVSLNSEEIMYFASSLKIKGLTRERWAKNNHYTPSSISQYFCKKPREIDSNSQLYSLIMIEVNFYKNHLKSKYV